MGWAEKPLLKGTVSYSFKHCGIAMHSPEKKAANKSTPQRAIRISERAQTCFWGQESKAQIAPNTTTSLHKSKAKSFFSCGRVGLPGQYWPFTIVIRNTSCWCKGQQRAGLVSTLVRRVSPSWRHLIGCWWVTAAEVHRQKHLIGCCTVSASPVTRSVMNGTEGAKAIIWIN